MEFKPHEYQKRAIEFIETRPACGLFMDMGLGKTVTTLTALRFLQDVTLETNKVLVIAPKSVALNTWTSESQKWDHLNGLRISIVMGTADQRTAALQQEADIYVTNRDNVVWLVQQFRSKRNPWPFDTVVLDESSSFKSHTSKRFKALRAVRPLINRIILLTGTPSPNGLEDLWAQVFLLDLGERLGKTLTSYRTKYFRAGRGNGHIVYNWIPYQDSRERITDKIADICLSMKASDYLQLPDLIDAGMAINLEPDEYRRYKIFEREQLMSLDGQDVEALTAAALANKLLQFTGGAVYDEDHNWHQVSHSKIEALKDIIETAGEPVLVYYQYKHEKERILKELLKEGPVCFDGDPDTLTNWNKGLIKILLCHPASVAYGLNMQQGGRIIVWFSPTWNLELYQQANARLYRQGQQKPVLLYRLIAENTIDSRVIAALEDKAGVQEALLDQIKLMRKELKKY